MFLCKTEKLKKGVDFSLALWYNIITGMRNTNRLKGVSTMKKSTRISVGKYTYLTKTQRSRKLRRRNKKVCTVWG